MMPCFVNVKESVWMGALENAVFEVIVVFPLTFMNINVQDG